MTATGARPASLQRSTAASVWPERISTPPSLATSGNTWPGRTKSLAPMLRLASARTVLQRCSADMPVVRPWRTSTETVKAVPSGASLIATIGGRCSLRASSAVSGAQTMPQPLRMMKAIFSVVHSEAATIRSPSFSRSSSSVTTTISPRAKAWMASATGLSMSIPMRRRRAGAEKIVRASPRRASRRRSVRRSRATAKTRARGRSSVTAPGERPIRRAKSARVTLLRLSQSPSFMPLK